MQGIRWAVLAVLSCAVALTGPTAAGAAPADLDRGFGKGGIAVVDGLKTKPYGDETARLAIGPKDEVFVLRSQISECDLPWDCPVALHLNRFDAAGVPDPPYAPTLSVRQYTQGTSFDLAVGPDGKAVIAATDHAAGATVVARFDANGGPDASFGDGGVARLTVGFDLDRSLAVAVQPDGKVVIAGAGNRVGVKGEELILARLQSTGELDPGFGDGGRASMNLLTRADPAGMVLGANGAISVPAPFCCIGKSGEYFGEGFSVARVNGADGLPDPTLGGSGSILFPTPTDVIGGVESVTPARDGGLYVSFEEEAAAVTYVGNVVKLGPDGSPNPGFGTGGRLRLYERVGDFLPDDIVADPEDRLVGIGRGKRTMAAYRLRPDGSVDRTFNGGQQVAIPLVGTPLVAELQSSGRIVSVVDQQTRFVLVALHGGNAKARCQGKRATIVGTNKRDVLIGTPRRDVIAALGGKDTVKGLAGADLICGGPGRDNLLGGPGRDSIQQDPRGRLRR